MSEKKNFLEQINDQKKEEMKKEIKEVIRVEKKEEDKPLDSFKAESFVKIKEKVKIAPIITILLLALLAFAAYYFLTQDEIIVADFTGMELETVSSWSDANGLMLLTKEAYDSINDEGVVIGQNLEAGYSIKAGDTLTIVVSAGPDPYERIELPVFDTSWSKTSVQVWLESNKVDNFAFKFIENQEIEGDYLIDYIITGAKQEDYSRSASLEFVFSQSEEEATVVMPNYLGNSLSSFDTWAAGEGFKYTYTESYSNIYSEGQIMSQNFTPDMERLTSDNLEVVVSLGASTETLVMGNLVNMSISEASSWLSENGLNISKIEEYNNDFEDEDVIEQSIDVGQEVTKGTVVELKVSKGQAVVVPDFSKFTYQNYTLATQNYNGYVLVNQRYNDKIGEGKFVSQSIQAGKVNDGEDPIEVIYSLGSEIIIPDFRNDTLESIHEWINEQNEFGANIKLNIIEDTQLNGDYGLIFKQNYYNKSIGMTETIEVVVSTKKVVPDFSKMTLEEAQIFAEQSSYSVIVEENYQNLSNYNDFIWQSVSSGSEVDVNTIVHVKYSLGMSVVIEDFREEPLSNLESVLSDYDELGMKIKLEISEYYSDDIPAGNIISQSIYNSTVTSGDKIEVIVSKGESYVVEDFEGLSKIRVSVIAEDEGLNIIFVTESANIYSGSVISQSIEPGTIISKSDFIYITMSE